MVSNKLGKDLHTSQNLRTFAIAISCNGKLTLFAQLTNPVKTTN